MKAILITLAVIGMAIFAYAVYDDYVESRKID